MTTPDLLAALDAQIERYQIAREVIAEVLAPKLLGPAGPAAKPRALPAGKADAPAPDPTELGRSPLVPRILRVLADQGPLQACDLARELGVGSEAVHYHLSGKTSLFRRRSAGRTSPWELTDAGRRAAAAPPPAV